eukprot:1149422-Pelagomonas_calceolata.AAC.17
MAWLFCCCQPLIFWTLNAPGFAAPPAAASLPHCLRLTPVQHYRSRLPLGVLPQDHQSSLRSRIRGHLGESNSTRLVLRRDKLRQRIAWQDVPTRSSKLVETPRGRAH